MRDGKCLHLMKPSFFLLISQIIFLVLSMESQCFPVCCFDSFVQTSSMNSYLCSFFRSIQNTHRRYLERLICYHSCCKQDTFFVRALLLMCSSQGAHQSIPSCEDASHTEHLLQSSACVDVLLSPGREV